MQTSGNRKERLQHKTRMLLVIFAAALLPAVAGCSPATSSTTPQPSSSASSEDRQAGWAANKLRVCIENKAQSPIVLEWEDYWINSNNEYLPSDQLTKTLQVNESDCAFTAGQSFQEYGEFALDGTWFEIGNDGLTASFLKRRDPTTNQILEPYVYKWIRFNGSTPPQTPLKLQGTANWTLTTYDKMTAYPVDFQVFYSP